jgi:hypothetical protein
VKTLSIYSAVRTMLIALAATLVVATLSRAQMGKSATPVVSGTDSLQTELHMLTDVQTHKADPQQARLTRRSIRQTNRPRRSSSETVFSKSTPRAHSPSRWMWDS